MEVLGLDTCRTGSCLQDLQKPQAANAGVAHAVDADFPALVYEYAVVPVLKSRPDRCQRVGVLIVEELESPFGKDQAEAECGIGWILLENFNLDFQFAALEQVGKIKAGGPAPRLRLALPFPLRLRRGLYYRLSTLQSSLRSDQRGSR